MVALRQVMACPLVAAGRIDPSPVLTDELALEHAPEGYALMADRRTGSVKVAPTPG